MYLFNTITHAISEGINRLGFGVAANHRKLDNKEINKNGCYTTFESAKI